MYVDQQIIADELRIEQVFRAMNDHSQSVIITGLGVCT